ncbi:MAG: DUF2760 domain-containing protein [SAR324 cluster bacterium]|nr:DUF2760 domain-containing protein [SAR324 cluster bacterium]
MQPEKNLNFLFRIFLYSFYCFFRVIFSRRAGNYIHVALAEVSRVNALEKSQRRLEKENKKRIKQGLPPLAVPEDTERENLAGPQQAQDTIEEKAVEESKLIGAVLPKEQDEISKKDEKNIDGVFLLSLFQKQGRLVDFLQQDIASFSNAEVGEAARVVHDGCARILGDYFTLEAIRTEEEGALVSVDTDYNLSEITLTGNLRGSAPYRGELLHHGWKISDQHPPEQLDPKARFIVQPAEIEVC